ncbi:MAG: cytochrome c family protein [Pseudorhodoplanes sp.]|uniref:c-type cytochrome n=1 Tax=Pseudorhodoplanes sp. TaxID=1934341 RepID=UPI003D121593
MDSFELNKILGALLATCLGVLTLNIAAGAIFAPGKVEKPGYAIAVPDQLPGGTETAKPEPAEPIAVRLANSDPQKGQTAAKQCAACHTFEKGGPNRVGPNLYGIVDRAKASHEGFNYSAALKAKGGNWTYDDLDHFIASPKTWLPGTSMGYAGLSRGGQRADLINYLHTLADNPVPLPKAAEAPAAAPKAADAAPAAPPAQGAPAAPPAQTSPAPPPAEKP